ncbi:MAG: tail fiber domain-containing protein [Acidobacteriota bacterium]|nr:tail fiber domain-containing protein [Acidobacteriota bacterium]
MKNALSQIAFTLILCSCLFAVVAQAQTTAFTYQGKLTDTSAAASGTYHMQFRLYGAPTGNLLQFGPTIENTNVSVNNGIFTVVLDFGSGISFSGLYMQISIKRPADTSYTTLTPRQRLTSALGAVRSLDANAADSLSALCDLCVTDSQVSSVSGSKVVGAVNDALNAVNANNATTAGNVTGVVGIANGGTGSSIKNFVDLSTDQANIGGIKTFTGAQINFSLANGFVARGGNGSVPASGNGSRMMWHAGKAAFRAGWVIEDEWDETNIGLHSVATGQETIASGKNSVAMGYLTKATGEQSFAMGFNTLASGSFSTAIGRAVYATASDSIALGLSASTNGKQGSFVFGDASLSNGTINATAPNQFVVRAQRIWLGTNSSVTATQGYFLETSTGAGLTTGGAWFNSSSRELKTNFAPVNSRDVLRKVLQLPIQTWNYKSENPSTRHIGAMSQDFHQFFKFGDSEESIATVDADGVALAAIQGLNEELKDELKDRDAKIKRLEEQVKQQQVLVDAMRKMLCQQSSEAEICKEDK